VTAGTPPRTRC